MEGTWFLYFIVAAVNFGMMSEGMFLGWSSPSLPKLQAEDSPIKVTRDQSSWIASVIAIGNVLASIFASNIVDVLGRKKSLLLAAIPACLSWVITGIATTAEELYAARVVAGVGMGISYMATTIYLAEVTPANIRGMTCGMMVPSILLGEIFIFAIGPRLPISTTAWISLTAPVLFLCLSAFLPESPYFLMQKNKFAEAEESLRRLRGTTELAEELRSLKTAVGVNALQRGGLRDLLSKSSNRRTLYMALGLSAVQQFSGVLAISAYSQEIFQEINNKLVPDINILPVALRILTSCICASLVDRIGRIPLLVFSAAFSAASTFTVALYFSLKFYKFNVETYDWIPVVAINVHSAVFALGLASLGNVIVGELFPLKVKAVGNCVFRCAESFYQFLVVKLYRVVADNFGMQYSFLGFTVILTVGTFFICFVLPETKGKTLEEIQNDMKKEMVDKTKIDPLIVSQKQTNETMEKLWYRSRKKRRTQPEMKIIVRRSAGGSAGVNDSYATNWWILTKGNHCWYFG